MDTIRSNDGVELQCVDPLPAVVDNSLILARSGNLLQLAINECPTGLDWASLLG
jgi:hypothetical protein